MYKRILITLAFCFALLFTKNVVFAACDDQEYSEIATLWKSSPSISFNERQIKNYVRGALLYGNDGMVNGIPEEILRTWENNVAGKERSYLRSILNESNYSTQPLLREAAKIMNDCESSYVESGIISNDEADYRKYMRADRFIPPVAATTKDIIYFLVRDKEVNSGSLLNQISDEDKNLWEHNGLKLESLSSQVNDFFNENITSARNVLNGEANDDDWVNLNDYCESFYSYKHLAIKLDKKKYTIDKDDDKNMPKTTLEKGTFLAIDIDYNQLGSTFFDKYTNDISKFYIINTDWSERRYSSSKINDDGTKGNVRYVDADKTVLYEITLDKYNELKDQGIITSNNKVDLFKYRGIKRECDNGAKGVNIGGASNDSSWSAGVSTNYSQCREDWWSCAWGFLSNGSGSLHQFGGGSGVSSALGGIKDSLFKIGNVIFILVTAYLGVKYIWGGVDSKFTVKNSLMTLVVAAIVFYGWNAVTDILDVEGLLTGSSAAEGADAMVYKIYNTIMYIINVAAVAGIIYIGIRYMLAGAEGKSELKLRAIPVIMGIIMVYGTVNLINFIVDIVVAL